jgi:hypothetical protein
LYSAIQEQLRARTEEVQSLREESARLRSALVDAELELQRHATAADLRNATIVVSLCSITSCHFNPFKDFHHLGFGNYHTLLDL